MTVTTFDASQDLLSVTPAAAEHFRRSLDKAAATAVRISIKESGCTGFKYVMDEVLQGETGDVSLALDNGVALFLDPEAVKLLRGTQIDYALEGVNRTLKFNNPNVVAECGCGESFSVS